MNHATHPNSIKIAFIGFGEAGQFFVKGWGPASAAVTWAYDIKTDSTQAAVQEAKWADYSNAGVTGSASLAEALSGAEVVFSTVTADQALVAAKAAAPHIAPGAYYFDCNSCSPGAKRQAAALIDAAAGRYVDTAIMSPVLSGLHKVPMLISGPSAQAATAVLAELQMNPTLVEGGIGTSSTIKMVRSIMMKGLEALFLECVLAGRQAGVDRAVLDSLDVTYPGFDFKEKAASMMERAMAHGLRRAAEMREVATTVDELGLSGRMARATVDWQQQIGDLAMTAQSDDYGAIADALLARLLPKEDAA